MDLISSPLSSHLDMTLSLIAGRVLLTQKEFNEIHQGDFVLLDFCSFAPDTKKGTFSLALGNMPLFQVKLREEKIKILDFSNYYEAIHMHESTDEEIKSYDEETIEPEPEEERSYLLEKEEKMVQPQNIPLNITVEVAKIKMSLDRLLQLRPGNVLELAVRPEQGVLLTVEGNPIARGQLLQVGEMIGVKILSIHD
jgi:flagellar motor switch protein FliN/FliY